jgi:hypothetical protein
MILKILLKNVHHVASLFTTEPTLPQLPASPNRQGVEAGYVYFLCEAIMRF